MPNDNVLTDKQRAALTSGIAALEKLGWTDPAAVLRALLATPQPEPRAEVTEDTVSVPKRVVELLRIINRDGIIKRASELQEVYRLVDAARTGASS